MKFFVIVLVGILVTNLNTNGGCCCRKKPSNNGSKTNLPGKPGSGPGKPINPGGDPNKPNPAPVNNTVTVDIVKKEEEGCNHIAIIAINKNNTVADLKFEIFKIDNSLLSKEQKLTYNGVLLADDNKALAEYNVVDGIQVVVEMNDLLKDPINIKMQPLNGKEFPISVKPSATIRELKEIISKEEGYTSKDLKLIHSASQAHLNDETKTVEDCNIRNDDLLMVIVPKIKPVDIKIYISEIKNDENGSFKEVEGSKQHIDINPQDTIEEFKEKFSTTINSEKNQFILCFASKMLEDNRTFGDYNIQKDSTLHYKRI